MKARQIALTFPETATILRPTDVILNDVRSLIAMHRDGRLGGEQMPEDVHPKIDRKSAELAHYFTLGMALNYQRNSYSLWRSCTAAWEDESSRWVFSPREVAIRPVSDLREVLVRYRVALQPNNHVRNWYTIAVSLDRMYAADVRRLFQANDSKISSIKSEVLKEKKSFPYLAGPKICNYWLYVMLSYTDNGLWEKEALSVAPDIHVMNSSVKLGVISQKDVELTSGRELVAKSWAQILAGTGIDPIDIHTPLWLWSRSGFVPIRH